MSALKLSRDEVLRVLPLLRGRLREGSDARHDAGRHKTQRNDGPDDAPALRRATVALGKHARVGAVDFAKDEVVALIRMLLAAWMGACTKLGQWKGAGAKGE